MEDSKVLMHGSEAETTEAGKSQSRNDRKRVLYFLCRAATCLVIAFIVFMGLDRMLLHSPEAVSGSGPEMAAGRPSDGSLAQLKDRVLDQWKEAGVIESVEWFPVREVEGSGYSVRARCLVRMPSGEYAASTKVFFLDAQGTVINVWNMAM